MTARGDFKRAFHRLNEDFASTISKVPPASGVNVMDPTPETTPAGPTDPMAKETMGGLFLKASKYIQTQMDKRPLASPVNVDMLKGLNKIQKVAMGAKARNLKGKEAVVTFIKAVADAGFYPEGFNPVINLMKKYRLKVDRQGNLREEDMVPRGVSPYDFRRAKDLPGVDLSQSHGDAGQGIVDLAHALNMDPERIHTWLERYPIPYDELKAFVLDSAGNITKFVNCVVNMKPLEESTKTGEYEGDASDEDDGNPDTVPDYQNAKRNFRKAD